jgi:hypothetical protein
VKLAVPGGPHLTYCSNIHPAQSWEETRSALELYFPRVKAQVCPGAPFGVGLRLSDQAARELETVGGAAHLKDLLDRHGLYVFTVNAFPFGAFHRQRVKEHVYQPDWRTKERREYTARVSRLLAGVLPDGVEGSVSTVPLAFQHGQVPTDLIVEQLLEHVVLLQRLFDETGKVVTLALEPEPACLLETTGDAVAFFEGHLFSTAFSKRVARGAGLTSTRATPRCSSKRQPRRSSA